MLTLLKELCALDGTPGREDEVREYIKEKVSPHAQEVTVDTIGNLIVFKKGAKKPKKPVLIAAHMDEVGFLAARITEDGMIGLARNGGIDPRVLIGRRVRIGRDKVCGVISIKAIHLTTPEERKVAPELETLYADIGASSKKEAEGKIAIGDQVVFDSPFEQFGEQMVKAKAIDDRIGCAVMIKLIESELRFDTHFIFSTNEEIGIKGISPAVRRIDPFLALNLEATTACDLPLIDGHMQSTRLRHGPALSLMDMGSVYDRDLRNHFIKLMEEVGIRWQLRQSANGGTDASGIHTAASGAKVLGVSLPTRYIHSAVNVAYLPDMEEMLRLAKLFTEKAGEIDV